MPSPWHVWLTALATDPEAAASAALAYEALPGEARDAWFAALEADAPLVGVPQIALYAPLLAVETDEGRRRRILARVGELNAPRALPQALRAVAENGDHACLLLFPLYLEFVEALYCRYKPSTGILDVQHDPLTHGKAAMAAARAKLGDAPLAACPLDDVIDELAYAVLADRRAGRAAPELIVRHNHLFAPQLT
jgi:hypothetical protein